MGGVLELAHVDVHWRVVGLAVGEERFGQGFGRRGLAHAGRAGEEQGGDGRGGVVDAGREGLDHAGELL